MGRNHCIKKVTSELVPEGQKEHFRHTVCIYRHLKDAYYGRNMAKEDRGETMRFHRVTSQNWRARDNRMSGRQSEIQLKNATWQYAVCREWGPMKGL